MPKYDKIYKIASIANFLIHFMLCVFIVIVSFLPFVENQNFYEVFTGFFDLKLSVIQPYFVLLLLLIAPIFAFFAIKIPALSVIVAMLTFSFFFIVSLPYSIEAAIVEFSSPWIGGNMSTYQNGFYFMTYASNVVYFDFAFVVYSFVILLIRNKKHNK